MYPTIIKKYKMYTHLNNSYKSIYKNKLWNNILNLILSRINSKKKMRLLFNF